MEHQKNYYFSAMTYFGLIFVTSTVIWPKKGQNSHFVNVEKENHFVFTEWKWVEISGTDSKMRPLYETPVCK